MNKEKVLNIPEHWGEVLTHEVINLVNGYAFKSDEFTDEGIPIIRISNIQDGFIDFKDSVKIKESKSLDRFIINKNDLLVAMSGATTGKMGIFNSNIKAYLNQRVGCLRIKNPYTLLKEFRNYFFKFSSNIILEKAYGGAQPNISSKLIEEIPFPIPPKGEQERIVKKIESCFAKIEATESNLDKIENLLTKYKESILLKAFRGELVPRIEKEGNGWELLEEAIGKKIPKNKRNSELNIPEHWGESELENCVNVFYGKGLTEKERIDGIYPVISSAGVVGFHNNFIFEGPLVVTGRKGSLGKPIFIKENCWVIDTAFALKPKLSLKTIFLFWWLKNQNIIELQSSTAIPSLTRETLYKLIFPVPPLKEQERIVQKIEHYFSKIEEIEKQIKQKRILLKKLKESILTKAFSGHFVERIETEGTGHDLLKEILSEIKKHEKVKKSIPVKKHPKKIKNENNECRV